MDEDRYKELFHEVERWILKSKQHFFVGNVLTEPMLNSLRDFINDRHGAAAQSPEFLDKANNLSALTNARTFYYGLSIENAVKAKQIDLGKIEISSGKPKGLRTDHNILEHVKQCGVSLSDEEEEFLNLLSYQTTTLSKYPIAKDLKSQNKFTGRAVGARSEEADIVRSIIHKSA